MLEVDYLLTLAAVNGPVVYEGHIGARCHVEETYLACQHPNLYFETEKEVHLLPASSNWYNSARLVDARARRIWVWRCVNPHKIKQVG